MRRRVSALVHDQVALFIERCKLGRSRLARHRHPWDTGPRGSPPLDRLIHAQTYSGQMLVIHAQLVQYLGRIRTYQVASRVRHLVDQLRAIEGTAIGDGGSGVEHLQRRDQHIALADSSVVGVTCGPYLAIVLALPTVVRNQTRRLAREIDPRWRPKTQRMSILLQASHPQALKGAEPSSHHAKKDVARLGDAAIDIQWAVPPRGPARKNLCHGRVVGKVLVRDIHASRASHLRARVDDPLRQSPHGRHQLKGRTRRIHAADSVVHQRQRGILAQRRIVRIADAP